MQEMLLNGMSLMICTLVNGENDRTQMTTLISPLSDFIDILVEAIDKLTMHSFTAKQQNAYYRQHKENLEADKILIQCNFSPAEHFDYTLFYKNHEISVEARIFLAKS